MTNFGAYIKLDSQLNLSYNLFQDSELKAEYPKVPQNLKMNRNIRRNR